MKLFSYVVSLPLKSCKSKNEDLNYFVFYFFTRLIENYINTKIFYLMSSETKTLKFISSQCLKEHGYSLTKQKINPPPSRNDKINIFIRLVSTSIFTIFAKFCYLLKLLVLFALRFMRRNITWN